METKSIKLGIWLLSRNDTPTDGEMTSCVVIESTETLARQLANEQHKGEGYLWTDGSRVSATRLGTADGDAPAGLVISSVE
jgi:hypothetical protein